jgi:hypothetical protein
MDVIKSASANEYKCINIIDIAKNTATIIS